MSYTHSVNTIRPTRFPVPNRPITGRGHHRTPQTR